MTQRMAWAKLAPEAYKAMAALEQATKSKVDVTLRELVKMRASYINGCAYCLDMHSKDAIEAGDTVQRMILVAAWHEADDHFTEREQAALALTDEVTRISDGGVSDEVWQRAQKHFSEVELADLTALIVTINAWNRFAITSLTKVPTRA